MTQREVKDIVKRYIEMRKAEGIYINKTFLYGSCLTNSANKDSVIDLLIVTDKDSDD